MFNLTLVPQGSKLVRFLKLPPDEKPPFFFLIGKMLLRKFKESGSISTIGCLVQGLATCCPLGRCLGLKNRMGW